MSLYLVKKKESGGYEVVESASRSSAGYDVLNAIKVKEEQANANIAFVIWDNKLGARASRWLITNVHTGYCMECEAPATEDCEHH